MSEYKEYKLEFGKFIEENRRKKKISQKEVAEQLGISQSYYSCMEHGARNIDLEMAVKICNVLGINLQDFKYVADCKTGNLIDITTENRTEIPIGEMLTGKIEKKSEGKSVSIYLTTEALKNLERFAKANGCSKSKAADLILRSLY